MKVIKWCLLSLVTVFILLVAYISLVFDPNDLKPQLIELVKDKTGRQLQIADELHWRFFPHLGVELGGIRLSNTAKFNESDLLTINQAVAEVALWPLLQSAIKIKQLKLDGVSLVLETHADGHSSIDDLVQQDATPQAPVTQKTSADHMALPALEIEGIAITNSQLRIIDKQAKQEQLFLLKKFVLGQFSLGKRASIDYEIAATLAGMSFRSEGSGALLVAADLETIKLEDFVVKNQLTGLAQTSEPILLEILMQAVWERQKQALSIGVPELSAMDVKGAAVLDLVYTKPTPAINLRLDLEAVDLDKLMSRFAMPEPMSEEVTTRSHPEQAAVTKAQSNQEPDLSALNSIDLDAALIVNALKLQGLEYQDVKLNATLANGVLNVSELSAALYSGRLEANAKLDASQAIAKYSFNKRITGVAIRPLLEDVAQVSLLSGLANADVSGQGHSLIPDNIKQNLKATGSFEVINGALYGVNIPLMLRQATAKLNGESVTQGNEEKKTDFTRLSGRFTLDDAVLDNTELQMESPLLRLQGKGQAQLIAQTLDYRLSTTVVGTLEGQGGKTRDLLKGVDIPLRITGRFDDPQFALDTEALFKSKVTQEADKLKEQLKNKLLDQFIK